MDFIETRIELKPESLNLTFQHHKKHFSEINLLVCYKIGGQAYSFPLVFV